MPLSPEIQPDLTREKHKHAIRKVLSWIHAGITSNSTREQTFRSEIKPITKDGTPRPNHNIFIFGKMEAGYYDP